MKIYRDDALDGRVAVVTGAGGGLGGAIVDRLTAMGATVMLLDLREVEAPERGKQEHISVACDISNENSVVAAAKTVAERLGGCDVLVSNAAVLPEATPLEHLSAETWDRVMGVNVRGAFLCAKHFGAAMLAEGKGSIVNLASIAATLPNAVGVYGPSKAAILALTRQIAVEWGPRGIRANAISPGLVRTPMSEAFYSDPAVHSARIEVVASRRIGVPEDIASVVAFLASDASAYVNGQERVVDGGFLHTALMNVQRNAQRAGT